jgi:hypothetical protein
LWEASKIYYVGDWVQSSAGDTYVVTEEGESGSTEPAWNTTIGNTTDDTYADWEASTVYDSGDFVTDGAGNKYEVTARVSPYESGASAPAWDTTEGNTTTDNDLTWTCRGTMEDAVEWTRQNLTVNWCGQSWSLTADSGVEKLFCGTYNKIKGKFSTTGFITTYQWYVQAEWQLSGLTLNREASTIRTTGGRYRRGGPQGLNINNIKVAATINSTGTISGVDVQYGQYGGWQNYRPIPAGTLSYLPYWQTDQLGILLNKTTSGTVVNTFFNTLLCSYSDYTLTDTFFGNTTLQGISFSWRKGNGW